MTEEIVSFLDSIKQYMKCFFPILWLVLAFSANFIFDVSDVLGIDREIACHYLSVIAFLIGIVEFFNSLIAFCEFQIFQYNNSLIDLDGKNYCIKIENGNATCHTYGLTEEQKKFPIRFNAIKKIILTSKYVFIFSCVPCIYYFEINIPPERLAILAFSILCWSIYMNKKFSEHYTQDYFMADMLAKKYRK